MNQETHMHESQVLALRQLLFTPVASFSEIQRATGLSSDHVNFHIKKLVSEGYAEKISKGYRLTHKGKEYANRLDTDEKVIEKQPKVSVAITLERKNEQGEREFLFQQRKKNPYFDFWGRPGGKVRWGESILEAARRELKEETGLGADFTYKMLYHKRDFNKKTGELLEDKIFLCVHAESHQGRLIETFEGGVNQWMTHQEFMMQDKRFTSVDEFLELMDKGESFVERSFFYENEEY
jgi:ADP-ribose pyrophosphatase YjhB (NUDIX family)/biotin operon repressor